MGFASISTGLLLREIHEERLALKQEFCRLESLDSRSALAIVYRFGELCDLEELLKTIAR